MPKAQGQEHTVEDRRPASHAPSSRPLLEASAKATKRLPLLATLILAGGLLLFPTSSRADHISSVEDITDSVKPSYSCVFDLNGSSQQYQSPGRLEHIHWNWYLEQYENQYFYQAATGTYSLSDPADSTPNCAGGLESPDAFSAQIDTTGSWLGNDAAASLARQDPRDFQPSPYNPTFYSGCEWYNSARAVNAPYSILGFDLWLPSYITWVTTFTHFYFGYEQGYWYAGGGQTQPGRTTIATPDGPIDAVYRIYVDGADGSGFMELWGSRSRTSGDEHFYGLGAVKVNSPPNLNCTPSFSNIKGSFALYGHHPQRPPERAPGVGPFNPGVRVTEDEPVKKRPQPKPGSMPVFWNNFGSGFITPMTPDGYDEPNGNAYATVGDEKVFVSSPTDNRIHVFTTDGSSLGSFNGAGSSYGEIWNPRGLAYYRGKLYVADAGNGRIMVFERNGSSGAYEPVKSINLSISPDGIDVAWNKVFVHSSYTNTVAIYHAELGVPLGGTAQTTPYIPYYGCQELEPEEINPDYCSIGLDALLEQDVSVAPEASMYLVGPEAQLYWEGASLFWPGTAQGRSGNLTGRGSGFWSIPNGTDSQLDRSLSRATTLRWCTCIGVKGTDWVWGMEWFVATARPSLLGSSYSPVTIQEYGSTEKRREWKPQQADDWVYSWQTDTWNWVGAATDVAYNARGTRLDAKGTLLEQDRGWLKGTHSLEYVVSDADILVVGGKGERWLEPSQYVDHVDLVDEHGTVLLSSSNAVDTLNLDTTRLTNGTHRLTLIAYLTDGQEPQRVINPNLMVDNAPPTGALDDPGPYIKDEVTIKGTMSDTHAGERDWQLEYKGPSQSTWTPLCSPPKTEPDADLKYTCPWNTTERNADDSVKYPDGSYTLHAKMRDKVQSIAEGDEKNNGGPNVGTSAERSVIVDNNPPSAVFSGVFWDRRDGAPIYEDEDLQLQITASDAGSGVKSIEVLVDGVRDFYDEQGCSPGTCAPRTYTFDAAKFTLGTHSVDVITQDRVGRRANSAWAIRRELRALPELASGPFNPTTGERDDISAADATNDSDQPIDSPTADFCRNDPEVPQHDYCVPSPQQPQAGSPQQPQAGLSGPEVPEITPYVAERIAAIEPPLDPTLDPESTLPPEGAPQNSMTSSNSTSSSSDGTSQSLASGATGWGIADANPLKPLSDGRLNHLGLTKMRIFVPWDAWTRTDNNGVRYEFNAAKAAIDEALKKNFQVLVSFFFPYRWQDLKLDYIYPTTPQQYTQAVAPLVAEFRGKVTEYTAWNEPNFYRQGGQRMWIDPKLAAQYWNELNYLCKRTEGGCVVGAGDFSDAYMVYFPNGQRSSYLHAYKSSLSQNPARWAWHAYYAGYFKNKPGQNYLRTSARFLCNTRTNTGPQPRIWITEANGMFHKRYQDASAISDAKKRAERAEENQAKDLTYLLDLPRHVHEEGENMFSEGLDKCVDASRIVRFYLYHWRMTKPGDTWDSGLTYPSDSLFPNERRDAFYTYQRRTSPAQ